MITDTELERLERLVEAATPGPWNLVWWGNEQYPYPLSILADNDGAWITRDGTVSSEANARLIAASREAIPSLISSVRELKAEAYTGTDDPDTGEPLTWRQHAARTVGALKVAKDRAEAAEAENERLRKLLEVSPENIEIAARGMYGSNWDNPDISKRPGEKMKDVWRRYAKDALAARLALENTNG